MLEKILSKNIQKYRKLNNLTLQALAQRSGLSKGYLSKVERGLNSPPFSTINQIALALGIDVALLFRDVGKESHDNNICLTKKNEGVVAQTNRESRGYRYTALATQKLGKNMIPYIIDVAPHEEQVFLHEGEEMFWIIEGKMELTYNDKMYLMEEGDFVYFDSNLPHSGKALAIPTRIFAVMYNYKRI